MLPLIVGMFVGVVAPAAILLALTSYAINRADDTDYERPEHLGIGGGEFIHHGEPTSDA